MDMDDLKRVNKLWEKIYRYLAAHVMEVYGRDSGEALELGPFSGGISAALARSHPKLAITIADESPEVVKYLGEEMAAAGLCPRIDVRQTDLQNLVFDDTRFDLVVFRGAFFFLQDKRNILPEIFRVLKKGGTAFVGGGFGKDTPQELIAAIADESRILNDRLGRRRVTIPELTEMVETAGLANNCRIEEAGGVWLNIRK